VTRDIKDSYGVDVNPAWQKGTAIVSQGIAGMGYIQLDATSEYSPFIDVILRNSVVWDDRDVKVRLGNLEGISDTDLGSLTGFGLYSDNAYLKGELFAEVIKTANSGSRIYMDTNRFSAYDDAENEIFVIYMDNPDSGYGVGDIVIGDYAGGQGIFWDASDGEMTLRGMLNADDITVGELSVSFLKSGTLAGVSILLDSASYMQSTNWPAIGYGWKLGGDGSIYMILPDASGIMTESYLQSENYNDGTAGWRLEGDGTIKFILETGSYFNLESTSFINLEDTSYIKSNNWVAATTGWKLNADGTIDVRIDQLTDATISSPTHRQCLFYYDGITQWKNRYPNAVYADDLAPASSSSCSSSSSSSRSSSSVSSSSSSLSSSSSSSSSGA
jgi:hypothetical protein